MATVKRRRNAAFFATAAAKNAMQHRKILDSPRAGHAQGKKKAQSILIAPSST
jgi:hypothetical protein